MEKIKNKLTGAFAIIALIMASLAWTAPNTADAYVKEIKFDEVCCGSECSYNRCLNYGDHSCCVDV